MDRRNNLLKLGLFLRKDDLDFLEPVPPEDACALILKHYIHFFRYFPADTARKSFGMAAGLCRSTRFFRLHFRKEPSFIPLLKKELDRTE